MLLMLASMPIGMLVLLVTMMSIMAHGWLLLVLALHGSGSVMRMMLRLLLRPLRTTMPVSTLHITLMGLVIHVLRRLLLVMLLVLMIPIGKAMAHVLLRQRVLLHGLMRPMARMHRIVPMSYRTIGCMVRLMPMIPLMPLMMMEVRMTMTMVMIPLSVMVLVLSTRLLQGRRRRHNHVHGLCTFNASKLRFIIR